MTTTAPAVPGQYFGLPTWLPGLGTQFFEGLDSDEDFAVTINAATTSTVNGLSEFTQDNIVFWWSMDWTIDQTITVSTGTVTTSPHFPFNYIGNFAVSLQSQYSSVEVITGYMLLLFNLLRPQQGRSAFRGMQGANLANVNGAPWPSANNGSNLISTPDPTDTDTTIYFSLDIPASMYFDRYWDVDQAGNALSPVPVVAQVSPQYMAGAARQVTPKLKMSPVAGTTLDTSPFVVTSPATATASGTLTLRRNGVYSTNNPEVDPPIYNWQAQHIEKQYSLAGRSKKTILLDEYGQITALILNFFDPTADAPITTLTTAVLSYGSALQRFNDTPRSAQRRFVDQHGWIPPAGVLIWDLALDPDGSGKITNAYSLNTLVMASCTIQLTFSATLSSTAYVNVGYEMLKYVMAGS